MKILILIPLILLIRWLIKTVNGFQKKEIRVQESLSGIEVPNHSVDVNRGGFNEAL